MPDHAQRLSLLAQTVQLIERGIHKGRWADYLPQERLLCDELSISRSTLRRALPQIESLGLIAAGARGKRRKILFSAQSKPTRKSAQRAAWLTTQPLAEQQDFIKELFIETQKGLIKQGLALDIVILPHTQLHHPEQHLASWLAEQEYDFWILHLMPSAVQLCFSQLQIPCYIFGNRAEGVSLPAISLNNAPAIQHAVHMLTRMGHRHLALLRDSAQLIGEIEAEEAFLANCAPPLTATVLKSSEDVEELARVLTRHFHPDRLSSPSAIICTLPHLALFTLTWLQAQNFTVPGEVSIILMRDTSLLRHTYPRLSYYAVPEHTIVPAALPPLLDLIQTGHTSQSEISIIPEFVAGGSVARAAGL